jgi:hypothetical protein
MKITIQSPGEKTIKIAIPTRMLFNGLTAKLGFASIRKYVSTEELNLSSTDLKRLVKEIRKTKNKYPHLELVNVESSDGSKIIIKL